MILLAIVVILGFFFRFYGARLIAFDFDERINIRAAKNISFDLKRLKLPLVDKEPEGILSERYLMRLGQDIFGGSHIGTRLPCVVMGALTILLVYFITRGALGIPTALISSFLVSVSLCSIASTRKVSVHAFLIFLSLLSLYTFYKAVIANDKRLMLLNGVILGIGFWFKESIAFLLPGYLIFLGMHPEHRSWLKNRYLWLSFLIAFCISLPLILANLNPEAHRFTYIFKETVFGPSLNSLGLYLGELILLIMQNFPKLFNFAAISVDPHYPPGESMVLGAIVLIGAIRYKKGKNQFLDLLWVCFLFNFILFFFLRRNDMIQSFWSLGSLMWGIVGLTPGIILAADMLSGFIKRHIYYGTLLFAVFAIFLLVRAWSVATYPLDCFFPLRDYCLENRKLQWEIDDDYLKIGDTASAKEVLKTVYNVTGNKPLYKEYAALRLAEILSKERRFQEANKYLDFVLSQDPGNRRALQLQGQLKCPGCADP